MSRIECLTPDELTAFHLGDLPEHVLGELTEHLETSERLSEHSGQVPLSPREIEVLMLIAQGLANKEVAARLGTARGTVKMHVQNILAKLNASDRTHAVMLGLQRGIIHL